MDGFVRDEFGDPIAQARVGAYRGKWVNGSVVFAEVAFDVADDRGYFRLTGLVPGTYTACAEVASIYGGVDANVAPRSPELDFAAPDEPRYYQRSCYPGNERASFRLDWAQDVHEDFTLGAKPAGAMGTVIRGRVTNAVVDADLAGDQDRPFVNLLREGDPVASSGTVNADGTFELHLQRSGRYVLSAGKNKGSTRSFASRAARRIVDFDGTPLSELELALQPVAAISVVIDHSTTPVPQNGAVSIGLRDVSSSRIPDIWAQRANDGALTFPPLDPGTYWLLTRTDTPFCIDSATMGGHSVLHGSITVSPGDARQLDIVLSTRCARIAGKVSRPEGVNDYQTVAVLMSGTAESPGDITTVYSAEDVSYSIDQLPPGRYLIWAWSQSDPGFPGPASLAEVFNQSTAIEVAKGESAQANVRMIQPGAGAK
jgi:hypothetical protein